MNLLTVVRARRTGSDASREPCAFYGACMQEVAVLGVTQLNHLALSHVASEMRDALMLKRLSVLLPSLEEAGP